MSPPSCVLQLHNNTLLEFVNSKMQLFLNFF
nr:MAG TPA: hypothetical protein [Myoviridae sp. ctLGX4]